jgi:PAS domain S-box-containing protein
MTMKIKIPRLSSLLDIPLSASEDARRQKMLEMLVDLIGAFAGVVALWAIIKWQIMNPKGNYENYIETVTACVIMLVGAVIIFILNRIGSGAFARIFFVSLLLLFVFFDTASQIADGRTLVMFSVPIVASAILIQPGASFILAIISSVIVEFAAHSVKPPLEPFPSIVIFFLLATLIWMATSNLENQIKRMKETNLALKESEERYRALVEISPDMVILTDPYGEIIVVNQAGLALFGFSDASEVVGKKVFEFISPEQQQRAITEFGEMVQHKSVAKVEYAAQTREGVTFFIELSASVLEDPNGRPQSVISVGRDVTLRKKTEQILQAQKNESQEAYQALVHNSAQGLVLLQNGRIILANNAIANCIGLTPEELYALPEGKIFDFVPPGDREIGLARNKDRLTGKPVPDRYETRLVHKNGTVHWLELMPSLITLNGIKTIQVTAIDITERKKAEEAMQAAHDRLDATLNTLPDMLFELNGERRFCGFRAMKTDKFFLEHGHFLEKKIDEVIAPDAAQIINAALDDALLHGQHRGATFDIAMPVETYSFELSISAMGDLNQPSGRFIMLVRDITERKRAENALRISEKKYRKLHESLQDGFVYVNMDGWILECNEAYQQMLGYSFEELSRLTYIDLTPEKWHTFEQTIIDEQVRSKEYSEIYEKEYRKKDGSLFPVELRTFLIRNEAGKAEGMWAIVRDITERKRAEGALRQSEERYRSLAEAAHDIIVIVDLDDRIEYANKFAAQLTSMSPEKMLGLPRSQFFPSSTNERHWQNLQKVADVGQPMFTESLTKFPTGEKWLSTWLVPLMNESGKVRAILGISRDISQRKALEESLLEVKSNLEKRVAERTADLINSHEQLRQLIRETVLAQENERKRLSRELHDEAGQALIGLTYSLGEILTETPDEFEKTRNKIKKTIFKADALNQRIRGMAHGLRPPILDVAGINLALQGFCREFSIETHFPVIYNGADNLPVLSEEISITLYRIVQEAMTNVVKHGHASEVHVSLGYEAGCITLTVRDNGIGFDTAHTSKGIGLAGMEERLGLLGGRLEIVSRRKHGTRLKAIIPLTPAIYSTPS